MLVIDQSAELPAESAEGVDEDTEEIHRPAWGELLRTTGLRVCHHLSGVRPPRKYLTVISLSMAATTLSPRPPRCHRHLGLRQPSSRPSRIIPIGASLRYLWSSWNLVAALMCASLSRPVFSAMA